MRKLVLSTGWWGVYQLTVTKVFKIFTVSLALVFATVLQVFAQEVPVSGRVTSDDGEGIPGVTVVVKGTSIGTVTDSTGSYSLSVPDPNAVLVFSYSGYKTQEVSVNGQTELAVSLESDTQTQEVVVIGYGTRKRKDVSGSVATVSGADLTKTPVPNFEQQLQGRVAGVTVTQSSGAPGAAVSVQIRGVGTTRTTEPLYVVDGVILSNVGNQTDLGVGAGAANGTGAFGSGGASSSPQAMLNPNDIESVEVLKDASAAAIYGARAANGVVIITTKKGQQGKPRVNFETYVGVQKVWNTLDLLNARQYAEVNNEARANGGQAPLPIYSNPSALGEGTDWQKAMFRTAPIRNHYMSISGGSKNVTYYIGGGFFKQEGTMVGTGFNRQTLRINTEYKVGKKFKFGENMLLARSWNQKEPWTQDRSQIEQMIKMTPSVPVYNPNNEGGYGGPTSADAQDAINPVGQANLLLNIARRYRILGNLYGEYEFFKGLKYRLNVGTDLIFGNGYQFTPSFFMGNGNNNFNYNRTLLQYSNNEYNRLLENIVSFDRTFGDHDISAVVGYTEQAIVGETMQASTNALPSNDVRVLNAGSSGTLTVGGLKNEYAIRSMLGRVAYTFKDKYLLTVSLRRDGSSNFGPSKRYAVFPSVSAGWRIGQESFLENVNWLSDLKIRGSWGKLGNDNIGAYGYSTNLNTSANYIFGSGQNASTGITATGVPNPNIRWESTAITDVGIDVALLRNRLTFTADYYNRVTEGLLVQVPLPYTFGVTSAAFQNAGKVKNNGIELALQYQESAGPLQYGFGGNLTTIHNKVLSLGLGEPIETGSNASAQTENITRTEVGQPIGYFYGYQVEGIFQDTNQVKSHAKQEAGTAPGDIMFKDINGDGVIDQNDRTKIGSPIPKFIYAFNGNVAFMGFDLNFMFQGVHGNQIYNLTKFWTENMGASSNFNYGTATLDRWTPEHTNTDVPRAVYGDPNKNMRISDRFVESGSYLRLRTIQIGYSIPESLLKKVNGLSKFRIYASAYNLLTFTKYSGFDPELAPGNQNNLARGIDAGNYPQARSFILGVQLGF